LKRKKDKSDAIEGNSPDIDQLTYLHAHNMTMMRHTYACMTW
jgi:hypothetical protein